MTVRAPAILLMLGTGLAAVTAQSAVAAPAGAVASRVGAEQRYIFVSAAEKIGHLIARIDGAAVTIDAVVDDNGRAQKTQELLRLDDAGYPASWSVIGNSDMGAPVREEFRWRNGRAQWRTLNDRGERLTTGKSLYVAAEASPWALGLYARAPQGAGPAPGRAAFRRTAARVLGHGRCR